jgi:hypothetical protein
MAFKRVNFSILCLALHLFVICAPLSAGYSSGRHEIKVNPTRPIHKWSKQRIVALRKELVNQYKELGVYPEGYIPRGDIYSQVDGNADWKHDTQFFVHNPYLLALTSAAGMVNTLLPYCGVTAVKYSKGSIQATYKGEQARLWFRWLFEYYKEHNGILKLWLVNSLDAGFMYVHVDLSLSVNVEPFLKGKRNITNSIHMAEDFYHVGSSHGKNNISPLDRRAWLRLVRKDAPTIIYIKLWRTRPSNVDEKEDFAYIISAEP